MLVEARIIEGQNGEIHFPCIYEIKNRETMTVPKRQKMLKEQPYSTKDGLMAMIAQVKRYCVERKMTIVRITILL